VLGIAVTVVPWWWRSTLLRGLNMRTCRMSTYFLSVHPARDTDQRTCTCHRLLFFQGHGLCNGLVNLSKEE
jgi:hypothetical protein